jgi:uncharacterized membrane protein YphA (DoxX/SURF4 family)
MVRNNYGLIFSYGFDHLRRLTRFQWFLVLASLVFLRLAIGFHFFSEGLDKFGGSFNSRYFFNEAKGPLRDFFRSYLDDPEGAIRLGLVTERPLQANRSEFQNPVISPDFTWMIWEDFVDKASQYYGFGEGGPEEAVAHSATGSAGGTGDVVKGDAGEVQQMIWQQPARALEILDNHKLLYEEFLDENRAALMEYFAGIARLEGFARDGQGKQAVAQGVDSLRQQIDTIKADRNKKLREWTGEVEAMWDSLELEINSLAIGTQKQKPALALHRPFDQPHSWEKWVDRIVPWFDTIIGVLLILGLFTRWAAGIAILFLISIIATQPPWIPGAAPTQLYLVELAGLCVLFAAAAGRIGGLDFFRRRWCGGKSKAADTSAESKLDR